MILKSEDKELYIKDCEDISEEEYNNYQKIVREYSKELALVNWSKS